MLLDGVPLCNPSWPQTPSFSLSILSVSAIGVQGLRPPCPAALGLDTCWYTQIHPDLGGESCGPQHHLRDIPWFPPHAACAMEPVYRTMSSWGAEMAQRWYRPIYTLRPSGPHLRPQWSKGAHGSLCSLRERTATHHYHPSQRSKSWLPASRGLHPLLPSPGCGWRGRPSCRRPHACTLLRKRKAVLTARRLLPAQSPQRYLATQSEATG